MKNIFRILLIVFLLFYSAACVGATRPIPATSEPQGTDFSTVKSTLTPTFTTLAPAFKTTFTPALQASPTIAASLTPTVNSEVEKKCLQILPKLPKDSKYSGQIVLGHPYALYDLGSGEKYQIPNNNDIPMDLTVSPDRTLYAYVYYGARQLVIATSDHKIKRVVAIPDRWHLSRWQNDKNLLFVIYETDPEDPHWGKYPPTLGLLNPFSGEKQILPPDFPDIDQLNPILNFEETGITVYDPMLSRVVYERGDWNVILWDILNKKQLAQLPFGGLGVTVPIWFPDGSGYIMMAEDGYFYLVARDGTVTQVSHISLHYTEYYSWSPDNRHLAFWRYFSDSNDRRLYLLDTTSGQISDFCIPAGYNPSHNPSLPIWSPDGRSIVVEANYNPTTLGSDVLLIDLESNTAFKIGENSLPMGWIIEP